LSDEYWRSYEQWKKIESIPGIEASGLLSREEANERR
jgi:hypothetical protein